MRHFLTLVSICLFLNSNAQEKNKPFVEFGKVTAKDFEPAVYSIDSSADGVILYHSKVAEFEADDNGSFYIVYKYVKRMRLLKKNSFDAASIEIPLIVASQSPDELKKLEAYTHNIENGKIVSTKVDKSNIFKTNTSKNIQVQKFTFPDLREGSIVEFSYTMKCPHARNLEGWSFQDRTFPSLWSEYEVTIPDILNFAVVPRDEYAYAIRKEERKPGTYRIFQQLMYDRPGTWINHNSMDLHGVWAMENMPALREENFTTTISNYLAQVDFYLMTINYPGIAPIPIIADWTKTADALLKNENFGGPLTESNQWVKEDLDNILSKASTDEEKIRSVFYFVRNNFECDNSALLLTQSLKKVMKDKKGSRGDVNLLMAAMLNKAGFTTHPVLLSTRNHGKPYEMYPILDQFNYMIIQVIAGDKTYLLDASDKKIVFNKLPARCYNGTGRVIDRIPVLLNITADSVAEIKTTAMFITADDKSKTFSGTCASSLGFYESIDTRDKLVKQTKEDYFKEIKKELPEGTELTNPVFDSLSNNDYPLNVKYDISFSYDQDVVYITPLFSETIKENPFKSAKRTYPVEMPYKMNETFLLTMDIPAGYKVDELPKSARIKLNDDEGMFEYLAKSDGAKIQLRVKIIFNKANFTPEDYETLRNFFAFIVNKESEQIVLKKVN